MVQGKLAFTSINLPLYTADGIVLVPWCFPSFLALAWTCLSYNYYLPRSSQSLSNPSNLFSNFTARSCNLHIGCLLTTVFCMQTMFDAPKGTDPVAIYLGSMGKGQAWVNGNLIGRYWSLVAPESGCPSSCNYPGAYSESKCQSNCGMPTQSWY